MESRYGLYRVKSKKGFLRNTDLLNLLGLNHPSVVSVIGGGGKTTLLTRTAEEAAGKRIPLLISTSTKIQRPCPVPCEKLHVGTIPPPDSLFSGCTLWVRETDSTGKKWLAPAVSCLETAAREIKSGWKNGVASAAPGFLIEADGSAGRPVKAPGADEPVVIKGTDTVAAVIGLSAIGRTVGLDTVHRLEPFKKITGAAAGDVITPEMLFRLFVHPEGTFKGCAPGMRRVLILNQAEASERRAAAEKLMEKLMVRQRGLVFPDAVVAAELEKGWVSDSPN